VTKESAKLGSLTPSLGNKILVSESPMGNYFKAKICDVVARL